MDFTGLKTHLLAYPVAEGAMIIAAAALFVILVLRLSAGLKQRAINERLSAAPRLSEDAYEFDYSAVETEIFSNISAFGLAGNTLHAAGRPEDENFARGDLELTPVSPQVDFNLAGQLGLGVGKLTVDVFEALSKGKEFLKEIWRKLAGKPLLIIENKCDEESWGVIKAKFKPLDVTFFFLRIDGESKFFSVNYFDKEKNLTSSFKVNTHTVSTDPDNPTKNKLGINLTEELLKFVRNQMSRPEALHSKGTVGPNEVVHAVFTLSETGKYLFYYTVNDSRVYSRCERVDVKAHKDYFIRVAQKSGRSPELSNVKMSDRPVA